MRRNILLSSALSAILFFGGCASDHQYRLNKGDEDVENALRSEKVVGDYYNKKEARAKRFSVNANEQWVYPLLQRIAKSHNLPLEKSFIPATDYKVSVRGNYSLSEILDVIYKQSGVDYILSDGFLKVKNSEFVDEYFPENKGCGVKGSGQFTLSLKDAPIPRIFGYFVEEKGYTVHYDLHNNTSADTIPPISFSYRGCSVRDALQRIAKATDLKIAYKPGKILEVRDYDTLKANVPSYYNLSFASSSSSLGESKGTGTKLTDESDSNKDFKAILQTFMSDKGKAYVSGRGYLVVEDRPASIARLKKILNKEVGSQQNVEMEIIIVSVELNDKYSSGVDWEKILKPTMTLTDIVDDTGAVIGQKNTLTAYSAGAGITNTIEGNAFTLSHLSSNGKLSMLQLLGDYGKAKIVKEHHLSTRSGTMSTLKAVEIIPYVTETSQITNGVAETQKEAKSVESGIIMNIKPTLEGNDVNMNVDITVSEYLGDKDFGDGFTLPMLKTNNIQAPLNMRLGDTTLLTGISLKGDKSTYSGVPNGQMAGFLSTLTGMNEDSIERKEYLIFIKTDRGAR